jgi:hypothetical protein
MKTIKGKVAACVLLLFSAACADLDVVNETAPDARRALRTAGDLESLIAGSYRTWWQGSAVAGGFGPAFSNMAWQHSGWPANFGVVFYSGVPRVSTINEVTDQFYGNIVNTWNQNYRALAAIAAGLQAIDADPALQSAFTAANLARLRAYAKFVQGLATASTGMIYAGGYVIDETKDVFDDQGQVIPQPLVDSKAMVAKGLEYFDQAAQLSQGQTWTVPLAWMSVDVSAAQLTRLAKSFKARYRAAVARTPAERAAVDWNAVVADIDAGVTATWSMNVPRGGNPWTHAFFNQYFGSGWQQLSYQVAGMADQSGKYQQWLAIHPDQRMPDVAGQPFLIITPDKRFPQGATLADQKAAPGTLYEVPPHALANQWQQPGRGTFRWSYYWARTMVRWGTAPGQPMVPEIPIAEMDLLKAEALYRLAGNQLTPAAAALVNRTRMAAGLDDIADGANDSCVPKLPSGQCGNFFEALKWEKRMETAFLGFHLAPWYFEGRGWGDLYQNTPLELPVPCLEELLADRECVNFGGTGGQRAAPRSTYAFPHEG